MGEQPERTGSKDRLTMANKKDWTGNKSSVFKTIGASNHTDHERQSEDYYATEPAATDWLCKLEHFRSPILEPSCGEGHISRQLIAQAGTWWIVVMARWPISSSSITRSGMAISLQTLPMPWHSSLWRKPCRWLRMATRLRCF